MRVAGKASILNRTAANTSCINYANKGFVMDIVEQ